MTDRTLIRMIRTIEILFITSLTLLAVTIALAVLYSLNPPIGGNR